MARSGPALHGPLVGLHVDACPAHLQVDKHFYAAVLVAARPTHKKAPFNGALLNTLFNRYRLG